MILSLDFNLKIRKSYGESLNLNSVNCVERPDVSLGSYGSQLSDILLRLGENVLLITLVGGYNGLLAESIFREYEIPYRAVGIRDEIQQELIFGKGVLKTSVIDRRPLLSIGEIEAYTDLIYKNAKVGDSFLLSMDTDDDIYNRILMDSVSFAKSHSIKVFLWSDRVSILHKLLSSGIDTLVLGKKLMEELCMVTLNGESDVIRASKMFSDYGVKRLMVEGMKKSILFFSGDYVYKVYSDTLNFEDYGFSGAVANAGLCISANRDYRDELAASYSSALGLMPGLTWSRERDMSNLKEIMNRLKVEKLIA